MKEITINSETYGIKSVLVDDSDYEWLNKWRWHIRKNSRTFYAQRFEPGRRAIQMHRLILGLTDSNIFSDHKDHNGLNNQRNNLRIATRTQNNKNKLSHKNSSSRFLGVNFESGINRWRARITVNYKAQYLGVFKSETDAAIAYNNAAKVMHGEFANLNVI